MVTCLDSLYDRIHLLNQERWQLTVDWLEVYGITQQQLIDHGLVTKSLIHTYINKGRYEPWLIANVETSILDILGVGHKRYILYIDNQIKPSHILRLLCLRSSQVILPWQTPSDQDLCIHLKLY